MPMSPWSATGLFFSASNFWISSALDMSVSVWVNGVPAEGPYFGRKAFQISPKLVQSGGIPSLLRAPSAFVLASRSAMIAALSGVAGAAAEAAGALPAADAAGADEVLADEHAPTRTTVASVAAIRWSDRSILLFLLCRTDAGRHAARRSLGSPLSSPDRRPSGRWDVRLVRRRLAAGSVIRSCAVSHAGSCGQSGAAPVDCELERVRDVVLAGEQDRRAVRVGVDLLDTQQWAAGLRIEALCDRRIRGHDGDRRARVGHRSPKALRVELVERQGRVQQADRIDPGRIEQPRRDRVHSEDDPAL